MNEDCKKINELSLLIRKIRVLIDIYCHKLEIERKKPQGFSNSDGFFASGWKVLKNSWNDSSYKKAVENLNYKISKYNEISSDRISQPITTEEIDDIVQRYSKQALNLSDEIFKNDKYKLGKIEFIINILFDDFVKYDNLDAMYRFISRVLGESDDYISNIKKELLNVYQSISIKGVNPEAVKLTAALLTGVVIVSIINPLIGGVTASASVTTGTLGGLFGGIGMAESILALCGVSAGSFYLIDTSLKQADKLRQKQQLKKEFYNLDVNQTTFSLAKSIIMITQINKYRHMDAAAEKIYSEYVENYIDIKSDITLNMLLSVDGVVNFEKSKVFNNVDRYLVNKLNIA